MSADLAELRDVAAQLSKPPGERVKSTARTVANFEAWMATELPGEPVDEVAVIAYLLAHEDWSWATAKGFVTMINAHCRDQGVPPLGQEAARNYLKEKAQKEGKSRLPKTEPLRASDIERIARAHESDDHTLRGSRHQVPAQALRAIVEVCRFHVPSDTPLVTSVRSLLRTRSIQVGPGENHPVLEVRFGSEVHTMPLDSDQAAAWRDHLGYLDEFRFNAMNRLRSALVRTGLPPDARAGALSDAQWRWLWANCDPDAPRRVRDLAYTLLGFTHARRHAELAPLQIEDVTATPEGYALLYRHTKTGVDHRAPVVHVTGDEGACVPTCPACSLDNVLEYERVCRGRTHGPVLATTYGGQIRTMSRQNGRLRVRATVEAAFGAPWGSTRSLRTGAATSAAEMGWPLSRIMQLTGHVDPGEAERYIRRATSARGTFQVPLT